MPRTNLIQALSQSVLLCDGAMGTQLMAAGLPSGACGELWNVERPDAVAAIHRDYLDAGCDLIITNTFGGSSAALERHGLNRRARELNLAGARLARQAAGEQAWVLGDVGPFGGFLEPMGETTSDELLDMFTAQIEALLEGGADAIIIETMSDPQELAVAVQAVRKLTDKPVIASYAFSHSGGVFRTMMGTCPADAIRLAIQAGADVVGANCGTSLSLDDYLRLADELLDAAGNRPVILQPNAGSPQSIGGKLRYPATPADMAAIVPQLVKLGVKIIGGCCGTTPQHLRAMSQALRSMPQS